MLLMTHAVNYDVYGNFVRHYTILRRVTRIVDPFPGVAKITIASDENHEPAVLIFNAHVMRRHATLFVSDALHQCRDSRHLDHTVEIEVTVEDGVCKRQVFDLILR